MSDTDPTPPLDVRDCAQLLLTTMPGLMHGLHAALRQRGGDDMFGQLRMLEMLGGRSWTLSELATRHRVTASTMSRSVDVLVKRDWVTREPDPKDRRQVILRLSDDGRMAHDVMVQQLQEAMAGLLSRLTPDELRRLYDGIDVLRELIERDTPADRCPARKL